MTNKQQILVSKLSNGQYLAETGSYKCIYTAELDIFDCSKITDQGYCLVSSKTPEVKPLIQAILTQVKR